MSRPSCGHVSGQVTPRRQVVFVTDFDETITLRDTTALVPHALAEELTQQGLHDEAAELRGEPPLLQALLWLCFWKIDN
jgi:hypothetical protein